MTADRRPVRAALAAGIVFGFAYLAAVPLTRPGQVALASDVYYVAAQAALAGENFYAVAPPDSPGTKYLYQPVVLVAFVPHVLTGSALGAYVLQTVLNVLTAAIIAVLVVRAIEAAGVTLERVDRYLAGGFVLLSVHSIPVYVMGQVNLQLALAIAAGAVLVEHHRDRAAVGGAVLALAATVKLFPAAVGVWLLRQRASRAVAGAVITGLSLTAAGIVLLGQSQFVTYLTDVLPGQDKGSEFAGGLPPEAMYVTVRRPLAALFPTVDPALLSVVALLLLALVIVAASWTVSTTRARLVALLATVLATLLYFPFEAFYFSLLYYPLVPLLYLLDPGRVRRLFVAGTILLSSVISYPVILSVLDALPLSPVVETTLADGVWAVFQYAQPPLFGAALLLAGCVLFQYERASADVQIDEPVTTSAE